MVAALNSEGIKDAECNTILNDWMEYCETIQQNGIIFCNMFYNVVVLLVFQCVSLGKIVLPLQFPSHFILDHKLKFINLISSAVRSCFQRKKVLNNPLFTCCPTPNRAETKQLVAHFTGAISSVRARCWMLNVAWTLKQSLQVAKNIN